MIFGENININSARLIRSYEPNGWSREEVLEPLVSMESVLATQALVMKIHKSRDSSAMSKEKSHTFAALNNSSSNEGEFYDGSLEEYMSCRVAKTDYDQWKMRVRFRQNELSWSERATSYVDDYSFDWLANGNHQAWYGNYKLTSTSDEGGDYTVEDWRDIQPLQEKDIKILHDRMNAHMFDVAMATRALRRSRRND